jgi:hypothetical protein
MTVQLDSLLQWFAVTGSVATAVGGYIKLRERLIVLETQVGIFIKSVSVNLSNVLHSPHTPLLDRLLEKIADNHELTKDEVIEMIGYLKRIINDPKESTDRKSSASLLMSVTKAKYHLVT